MDYTEEDFSAKSSLIRRKNERQSQVRDMFQEIISWRDESHRHISHIISSHNKGIDKGYNDLVEEVSKLQNQISVLRKERTVFLETIDSLNGDLRQMSAKLPLTEPEVHELDIAQLDTIDIKEECVETPMIRSETGEKGKCIDKASISHQSVQPQKKIYPMDDQNHLNESTINELDDVDFNDSLYEGTGTDVAQDKVVTSNLKRGVARQNESKFNNKVKHTVNPEDFVCKVCKFAFSTSENLTIHIKNIHSKLEKSKVNHKDDEMSKEQSDQPIRDTVKVHNIKISKHHKLENESNIQKGYDKLKCKQCPYKASSPYTLNIHIKSVHAKIRDHNCHDCGYSASQKGTLKRHMASAHKISKKQSQKPPKSTKWVAQNVPKMGDKRSKCITKNPLKPASGGSIDAGTGNDQTCNWESNNGEVCGKRFKKRYNLVVHMRVHEDKRPFQCTLCDQTFRQKAHLQRHETTHRDRSLG